MKKILKIKKRIKTMNLSEKINPEILLAEKQLIN